MNARLELEVLVAEAFDGGEVTEVIRPAAVLPEQAARRVLTELALRDVRNGDVWRSSPTLWQRFDRPWDGPSGTSGSSQLIGGIQVAYGTPSRYEITVYRATITPAASAAGWTVQLLCDEAFAFGGLTLAACPRVDLAPPPPPFRLR